MKYIIIFLYWFLANFFVRVVNSVSAKMQQDNLLSILKTLWILLIPILLYNFFFILFFNYWSKNFSFITLEITSLFFALVLWILFQIIIMKSWISRDEIIWLIIVVIWIIVMNKNKLLQLL